MPTMHIPEDVFEEYVVRNGSFGDAKDEIKDTLRQDVGIEA